MEEGKRQRQVARLIQEEMTNIFQQQGLNVIKGGMISITQVKITPDLLEARIYLSFFHIEDPEELLERIRETTSELRREIGNRLRHNLRRIPELQFFKDETLEQAFHINDVLLQVKEADKKMHEGKEEA